jgi:hypothetical protein
MAADVEVVLSVYRARDDGWHRKLLSGGVRTLILALHGVRLRSDGPYLFRRVLFDPEQLTPDTFFLNFEFPIRALRGKLRVATVEIECVPRRAGSSKSTGLRRIAGVARDLIGLRFPPLVGDTEPHPRQGRRRHLPASRITACDRHGSWTRVDIMRVPLDELRDHVPPRPAAHGRPTGRPRTCRSFVPLPAGRVRGSPDPLRHRLRP